MSRGPGRWQREILESVASYPPGSNVVLTYPGETVAHQVAFRRAAYRLEALGLIVIASEYVDGVPRLVAYRPDDDVPPQNDALGLDGKQYRRPRRF